MKYKDPITGEIKDITIKSGDTLPIGTIVEFDGDTIPDGYEEFETEDYGSLGNVIVDDIICKNMFNKNSTVDYYYLGYNDGTPTWDSNMCYMPEYIEVDPNEDYVMSHPTATIFVIHEYDANKKFIGYLMRNDSNNYYKFKTQPNTRYVRLSCGMSVKDKMMFEKGPVATDYVEHKEFSNKQVYSTNEQIIGTWVDGKPLYRKTIVLENFTVPANGDGSLHETKIMNLSNIDHIDLTKLHIKCAPSSTSPYIRTLLQNTTFADGNYGYVMGFQNNLLYQTVGLTYIHKGCITVEYTKTTD